MWYIGGLVQERRNSTANALELPLSCTNPLTCTDSANGVGYIHINCVTDCTKIGSKLYLAIFYHYRNQMFAKADRHILQYKNLIQYLPSTFPNSFSCALVRTSLYSISACLYLPCLRYAEACKGYTTWKVITGTNPRSFTGLVLGLHPANERHAHEKKNCSR